MDRWANEWNWLKGFDIVWIMSIDKNSLLPSELSHIHEHEALIYVCVWLYPWTFFQFFVHTFFTRIVDIVAVVVGNVYV